MAKLGDFILHKKHLKILQVQPMVAGRVAVGRKNYISPFTPPLITPPREKVEIGRAHV